MTKEDFIYINGKVMEMLANRMCRVKLEDGRIILCYLKSNINKRVLKLMMGDDVSIEMSLYDQDRGRVVGKATNGNEKSQNSATGTVNKNKTRSRKRR